MWISFILALALTSCSYSADLGHVPSARVSAPDLSTVHFWLWTRQNPGDEDYYELILDDVTNLANSPFDGSRPTQVFAHGWDQFGRQGWTMEAKTEFLAHYDCNIISIDWGNITDRINYPLVVADTPEVANHSAKFLDFLHNEGGLDLSQIHLAGHSLGAHMAGYVGAYVQNGPIGHITGLDPAGPAFYDATDDTSLGPNDANFVDIIHTEGCSVLESCNGIKKPIGHVDYYPNGGEHMPIGADGVDRSHHLAPKYWIESINGATPFTSRPCVNWDTYLAGGCPDCGQGCLNMGAFTTSSLRGNYYLTTNADSPFAQG